MKQIWKVRWGAESLMHYSFIHGPLRLQFQRMSTRLFIASGGVWDEVSYTALPSPPQLCHLVVFVQIQSVAKCEAAKATVKPGDDELKM